MSEKFKAIVIDNQNDKFSRKVEELDINSLKDGNVLVKVDYSDFINDLDNNKIKVKKINTNNLIKKIKMFFKKKIYIIEYDYLEKLSFDELINTIIMISPFSSEEKQKLIETTNLEDKFKIFEEIINFNLLDNLENKTIQ